MIGALHERFVFARRAAVLAAHFARLLPARAKVLDVGCGDGRIARAVMTLRPDLEIRGIDVLQRPGTAIPVQLFDGERIPYTDSHFDCIMFVDVLHHTHDPAVLLTEAARVARSAIVIKDHLCESGWARARLRLMDWAGNAHHGVALPYTYWPRSAWQDALAKLHLKAETWNEALGLYPPWADWCLGTGLHFVASITRSAAPRPG